MRADYGGIVYIEEEYAYGGDPPIYGSWQKDEWFEEGPGWPTAAEAIAWGRHRAPLVYLRIDLDVHTWRCAWVDGMRVRLPAPSEPRHVHYSAGEVHAEGHEFIRWPGSFDRRDEGVADGYGGAVWLVQSSDVWHRGELVGYSARWDALRDGVLTPKEIAGAWVG